MMTDPVLRIYHEGFCPTCGAPIIRRGWLGKAMCKHKPGCLTAKRERRSRGAQGALERAEAGK